MNKNRRPNTPTLLIIILISLFCSGMIYWLKTIEYQSWLPTIGTVLSTEKLTGHNFWSYRTHFQYQVNNQTYTSSYVHNGPSSYQPLDIVTIYYNPNQPDDAKFYQATPGLTPFLPQFIGIPLVLIILNRKNKHQTLRKKP